MRRSTGRITGSLLVACLAWPATATAVKLPELGSKRRVVLAELREAGLTMLDGAGNRLEFAGGPEGLADAATTSCRFDGLDLVEVRLDFAPQRDDRLQPFFARLTARLTSAYGKPCATSGASARPLVTRWCQGEQKITLRGERSGDVTLSVAGGTSSTADSAIWRAGNTTTHGAWDPDQFAGELTTAKRMTEDLLHDLGGQPFWAWGARRKGSPVTVRLAEIALQGEPAGLDEALVRQRFLYFTRGHWELAPARGRADVEVELHVVPTMRSGTRSYLMRLVARVAKGKQRGRVLFSGVREM